MHVIFYKSTAYTMVKKKLLKQFFRGKNIFSAHTGYGKSLIFQVIPITSDVLNDEVVGSSTVLVISPLKSLMKDQVRNCNERLGGHSQRTSKARVGGGLQKSGQTRT